MLFTKGLDVAWRIELQKSSILTQWHEPPIFVYYFQLKGVDTFSTLDLRTKNLGPYIYNCSP